MKTLLLTISLALVTAAPAIAQTTDTRGNASAGNSSSISKQGRQVDLQSNTQLAAQLENSLDARHAKVGDRVALKTTQAVKQNGAVVVPKGSRLLGHVTDVQQRTKNDNESVIGIAFDRLQKGSMEIPITATIVSITQAQSRAQSSAGGLDSDMMSSSSARSSSSASSGGQRSGGGGLLGGAGNTVGGVVNTTNSTVGNVTSGTTNAVGSTVGTTTNAATSATGNLGGSLKGLQINQSSSASAQGGSSLSLTGGNLHLESGTTFNLLISSSTSAGNP